MTNYLLRTLRKPEVVFCGGGGGTPYIAKGFLAAYPSTSIAIVVAMADRGGSTGKLLKYTDNLPVGDLSMAFCAVSAAPALLRLLNLPRFSKASTPKDVQILNQQFVSLLPAEHKRSAAKILKFAEVVAEEICKNDCHSMLEGHSYRNFTFVALMQYFHDIVAACSEYGQWLDAQAAVFPVTNDPHYLVLEHVRDGKKVELWGEDIIDNETVTDMETARVTLRTGVGLTAPKTLPDALRALSEARVVVVGPGSPLTSLCPSFLYDEVLQAVYKHDGSDTKQILAVSNLCKEKSTPNITLEGFVRCLQRHGLNPHKILVNTAPLPDSVEAMPILSPESSLAEQLMIFDKLADCEIEAVDMNDRVALQGNRSPVRHNVQKVAELIHGYSSSRSLH